MPPLMTEYKLDDLPLQKLGAIDKIGKVLTFIECESQKQRKITRLASSNQEIDRDSLVKLFMGMVSALNLKVSESNVNDIVNNLSKTSSENTGIDKKSSKTVVGKERKDDIKIVSKSIKDSHYQVDISKDIITKEGKKIFMVSCYARDAYLGRYLIKRNFFYTAEREESADNAYDEIVAKMNAIKERYYNEVIDVSAVSTQFRKVLDGVISEIKSEEDSISTNINR